MTQDITRVTLAEEIARAVRGVPGAALLRPGPTDPPRTPPSRPEPGTGRSGTAVDVSVHGGAGDAPWHVEVRLVAPGGDRSVDVARAARRAVEERLTALLAGDAAGAHVSVTVTGRI
ncbi:hypothetical protein [Streptomyces sp. NPDC058326]|uniref:hypothetical protein n=1 Tax=Streptomyces sp. NPDC058326 TaxID=3346447 RepID=UPI0036EB7B16